MHMTTCIYLNVSFRVAQVKSAQQKAMDDLYEMSKPLARYRDDEDLEALLKEKDRDGDPMLAFIKKKKIRVGRDGKPKKGTVSLDTSTTT